MWITAGVNAGLAIQTKDTRILLDALHNEPVKGFSSVTPERWNHIQRHPAFVKPDIITWTHTHEDHCSEELVREAVLLWPNAKTWRPANQTQFEGTTIRSFPLIHEHPFEGYPNFGLLIEDGEVRLLVAGDCAVGSPELAKLLRKLGRIDAIVLPFPWISISKGVKFISEHIPPDTLLLVNHLPLPQDDVYRYRTAVDGYSSAWNITAFTELFQTIHIGPA